MSGYSTENTNLQNEMDYTMGNPVAVERGSSVLDAEQFYDCVEQFSNTEPYIHDYRNLRFRDQSSETELSPPMSSLAPGERNTIIYGDLFGNSYMHSQQPGPGTSLDEQKIAKKFKNLGITNDKRRDQQALSVVLKNLKELEGGFTPEHRISEPSLISLTKSNTPESKVTAKSTKKQQEKDKPSIPFICGPPGASLWCTQDPKKAASDSAAPSKEISTLRNLRLDSLEDYFKLKKKK